MHEMEQSSFDLTLVALLLNTVQDKHTDHLDAKFLKDIFEYFFVRVFITDKICCYMFYKAFLLLC